MISGLSQNPGQLIAARAFQGIGVGGLQALVQVVIAAIIPPRERGRYNGYLGGTMAVATVAGPLLGGLIADTSWLGWRWCFFVGVPIAVIALILLQLTLHVPTVRRKVKIDYLGASLITTGVSTLLIWVSFVDSSFPWLSWQTAAMVGGASSLNIAALPAPMRQIVQTAYGDAIGNIFLISAVVGILGIFAAVLLRPAPLRTSLDKELADEPTPGHKEAGPGSHRRRPPMTTPSRQ